MTEVMAISAKLKIYGHQQYYQAKTTCNWKHKKFFYSLTVEEPIINATKSVALVIVIDNPACRIVKPIRCGIGKVLSDGESPFQQLKITNMSSTPMPNSKKGSEV